MDTLVEYTVNEHVARLTLNSPHNRNALSNALVSQLHQGLRDAAADPAVRVVVLGHTGNTFCAGADLSVAIARPTRIPPKRPPSGPGKWRHCCAPSSKRRCR